MPTLAQTFFQMMPAGVRARLLNWAPPHGRARIELPDESAIYFDRLDQSQLLKILYWGGLRSFEFNPVMLFWTLAKDSRVILDIGSYIGYYAIIAAKANPAATILSFEPVPENLALQRRFLQCNHCDNVTLLDIALGRHPGEATFFLPEWSNSKLPNIGSLTNRFLPGETYADRKAKEIRIAVDTIDGIVASKKLPSLDLIKIDVEDMEWQVIAGGQQAFAKWQPDVIAEVSPASQPSEQLMAAMHSHGYGMFEIGKERIRSIQTLAELDYYRSLRGGFSEVLFSRRSEANIAAIDAERLAMLRCYELGPDGGR